MAQLLRLRKKAKNLAVPLDNLLTVPDKENLTMALFRSTYPEYDEWRQSFLRKSFPSSLVTEEFLVQHSGYLQKAEEWTHRLQMLENHFSFTCPNNYCRLRDMASHLLYDEYVRHNLVRLLYHSSDALLQFRRTTQKKVLTSTRDLLNHLYSWYHSEDDEKTLTKAWRSVYMACYQQQRRTTLSWVAVENHLITEYHLCQCLPGATSSFFEEIRRYECASPSGDCMNAAPLFPVVLTLDHVVRGLVLHRESLVGEWEPFVSQKWETTPWEAVALTGQFLDRCEVKRVRTAILKSLEQHVLHHAAVLVKTMVRHETLVPVLFQYIDEGLAGLVESLVHHLWTQREGLGMREDAQRLLCSIQSVNEPASLPLRSFVHDLEETADTAEYRVFTCRRVMGTLPRNEVAPSLLPESFAEWKKEWVQAFHEKYPHRKFQWLDWQSTVELTCGWTMSLLQFVVLRLVDTLSMDTRGLGVRIIVERTGWDRVYVCGVVHSLVFHKRLPLLRRESRHDDKKIREDDVVTLCGDASRYEGRVDFSLPVFSSATSSHRILREQDEKLWWEATTVRLLKREGPLSLENLTARVTATSERLEQVLQGLVDKEYARVDPQNNYHYVA